MQKEREDLVDAGATKKRVTTAVRGEEELCKIPSHWAWGRLADVTRDFGQEVPNREFTYIDVGSIDGQRGRLRSDPSVLQPKDAPSRARKLVRTGTVIYSTVRPYLLNIAIVDREIHPKPIASTAFGILHPLSGLRPEYLRYYLRSRVFTRHVEAQMTGMAYPAINDTKLFRAPIAIPPLEEQCRIVAMLDNLMALCDELEEKQAGKDRARGSFASSAFAALADAASTEQLRAAWSLVRDSWHITTAGEETTIQLPDLVRDLAIHGHLAKPSSKDQDTSDLLSGVEAARHVAEAEGRRRRVTIASPDRDSIPFPIPDHWTVEALGRLCMFVDYRGRTPPKQASGIPLITAKNIRIGYLKREPREYVSEATYRDFMTRGFPRVGDVLFTTEAPLGNAAVVDFDHRFALAQRVINLQPYPGVCGRFIMHALLSPSVRSILLEHATGMTATGIRASRLKLIPIPLPPREEQQRIAAAADVLIGHSLELTECLSIRTELQGRLALALSCSAD